MNRKNAGVSLVEVVVIIAVIAIMAGVGGYGIGQIFGFRARECASYISTSLTENKIKTLGKAKSNGNITWELYRSGDDFYVRTVMDANLTTESYTDVQKVNEGKLNVGYSDADTGEPIWLDQDGEKIELYFNRSSGALCDASSGNLTSIKRILVNYGQKTYTIEIKALTGKIVSNT